ncbi:MAG: ATP-dependent RNA helicase HrpA [Verrucomicrobiales bacterium]|nr:ATP-dependent RNA helicase HrpA [Verrucomicrobiales bacterium]
MSDPRIDELRELLPRCLLADWVRLGSRLARVLRDRRHETRHDAVLDRLLERARTSAALCQWRRENVPRPDYPPELPLTARHDDILAALKAHQVIVVAGETGSGKTTQLPKICLEAGLGIEGKIACTQPRRVAALSVSRRIASELGVAWGREVGCKIRFDDRSSPETFIKMMTDGMLLAEMQGDPLLSEYNAIVIDEAHERSLNIDFLLGHLKGLLAKRADLKLVITSATIDTAAFSAAFGQAPVIEVSGRMFPVEVFYAPLDAQVEESGELTYVDAAVRAVEEIVGAGDAGDILVFMPGERDIRETVELLGSRLDSRTEVIPLFGRLSAGDQERVFAAHTHRRVVVSTNIAETSLTLPDIRYVIDTGLARLSRYNPRTRTRRLPIEPISQSSANQRKGRAGRVRDGVCIRLYSEDDYLQRPPHTQPEIQRANLAEVILRMKAFHLGEIETFPFLNPPSPAAIQGGYTLLHELGALDDRRELTVLGRDLARLPIDPTLGRMLLQAHVEHATRELLIIASGLSIQDPRERPLEQQTAADAAHRRFVHPESDFLTLLNIWDAVHDQWEALRTQNQRRRFCRTHFLSYTRMREWQDLYSQLHDALVELTDVRLSESNARYEAVHRAILSGLVAHACRREERNLYLGGGNRRMTVFPGSSLFERVERPPKRGPGRTEPGPDPRTAKTRQPAWMVAGEIVETTQVYARTVAGIDPRWILAIAPHLCKVTHRHPRWSARAGKVLAEERTTFQGMEIQLRWVAYGTIQPKEAGEIFIRAALVEELLVSDAGEGSEHEEEADPLPRHGRSRTESKVRVLTAAAGSGGGLPPQYAFLTHNRVVRQKVEDWQTRVRRHEFGDLDAVLFEFYARHLSGVCSRDELNAWIAKHAGCALLCITEAEFTGGRALSVDGTAFPDRVELSGQSMDIKYAYAPGEEHDGVTVQVPFTLADRISAAALEWAVPGVREAKAEELLRGLPKSLRAQLQPIAPKAAEIAREFEPSGPSLVHDLTRFVFRKYNVQVPPQAWAPEALPNHLRARIEILGDDHRPLASARDLAGLRQHLASAPPPVAAKPPADSAAWARVAVQWEKVQLSAWSFGDLPEKVVVEGDPAGGAGVWGWLGLEVDADGVHLRVHRSAALAEARHGVGVRRLVESALQKDWSWVRKDLRAMARLAPLYADLGTIEELEDSAFLRVRDEALAVVATGVRTKAAFESAVAAVRAQLPGMVPRLVEITALILDLRGQALRRMGVTPVTTAPSGPVGGKGVLKDFGQLSGLQLPSPAAGSRATPGMASPRSAPTATTAPLAPGPTVSEVRALVPPRFLEKYSAARLKQLPRYLKAVLVRAERASGNAQRDRERAAQLMPYLKMLATFTAEPASAERSQAVEEFRWMLEEYRVSLFAQELGTAMPVSPKRLDEVAQRLREMA